MSGYLVGSVSVLLAEGTVEMQVLSARLNIGFSGGHLPQAPLFPAMTYG